MITSECVTRVRQIPETARELMLGILLLVATMGGAVAVGRVLDHIPSLVTFDTFLYESIHMGSHPAWLDALVSPFNFNFLPW